MTGYDLTKLCIGFDFGHSNAPAKAVLVALASFYNPEKGDVVYAQAEELVVLASCSRKTVFGALAWLKEVGLIESRRTWGKNEYSFNFDLIRQGCFVSGKSTTPVSSKTTTNVSGKSTTKVSGNSATTVSSKTATWIKPNTKTDTNQIQTDSVDPFAPLSEQIESVNRPQSDDFLSDPLHVLTAPELVRLCVKNRIRIGSSSALVEICKKQILTVLAAERLINEFKRTNYSVNYLVGMFRNFANEAQPIVQEEQKPLDLARLYASDEELGYVPVDPKDFFASDAEIEARKKAKPF